MSAAAPMAPLQAAVHAVLTGDDELAELITGVHDYVPEGTAYPYVVIGEALETPDNAHGRFGRQTVLTLHVWSQYRGYGEALAIGARVMTLLDHQPLTITGLDHIATRYELAQTLTDPEPPGDIRHLIQRYRILTGQPTG
ncbi:DUF3168 domain-containing protein [Kitasatospora purpeofusca]|uniref:DUF3168 domain-containing protein n=1 Tax=Kitasatospora purpeofusca TaxID=67352 RepID=UPI00225C3F46|nr:DUF3168 domain-containing protein [Kitasatospora purpeofusca]MCX4686763.1 DUF3168 domain-containing protein [Kitasatospora purpeofusca]